MREGVGEGGVGSHPITSPARCSCATLGTGFRQTAQLARRSIVSAPALPRTGSSIGLLSQPPSLRESSYEYFRKISSPTCLPRSINSCSPGASITHSNSKIFQMLFAVYFPISSADKKKTIIKKSPFFLSLSLHSILSLQSPQRNFHTIVAELLSKQRLGQSLALYSSSSITSIDAFRAAFI